MLRISADRIYNGDFTHARNRNIQKMFRMIGYGDNIGSGFQKVLAAWNTLGYLRPELKELDEVKEVWLSLPLVRTSKSDKGTSKFDSTVNSTVASTVNPIDNQYLEQENKEKEQVKGQVNLTETQKEVLIYLLDHP